MNNTLWSHAENLADRLYDIEIEEDTLSDGQIIFLARHPELPSCKAQGSTIDNAVANLNEARLDYIYALLELGLEVPPPASHKSHKAQTETVAQSVIWVFNASIDESDVEATFDRVIQPQHRKHLVGISFQGDLMEQD